MLNIPVVTRQPLLTRRDFVVMLFLNFGLRANDLSNRKFCLNRGAYHLAKKSGNFGLRSNGKAIFRKIFSEIVDNLQR